MAAAPVVPLMSMGLTGVLIYAEGNVQLAQRIPEPMLTSNVEEWLYPLLHFPANLILAPFLVALVAWFLPASQSDTGYYLRGSTQYREIQ